MKHLRNGLVTAGCAAFISVTCFGQTVPSFTTAISASGPAPSHVYAVDVNNDGLTDILQDSASPGITGSFFSVSINTGKGLFAPPINYKINSTTWTPLTWGDFNNDGKVDIAVVLSGTNQVAVYLGNGDGTFQQPVATNIELPSGITFGGLGPQPTIVAADFNHDGKLDLVAAAFNGNNNGGNWAVYLLDGDGTGGFTNPTPIYYPTSGWTVQNIVGGDFDTDGNADVSVLEAMWCDGYILCESNVVTLFGRGDPSFDAVDVTTVDGQMTLGAADLNNDGATDLYGIEDGNAQNGDYGVDPGGTRLAVFLGHYDRSFSYLYTSLSPYEGVSIGTPFAVADFNGTQQWALAALAVNYESNANYQMIYFFNAGTSDVSIAAGPSPAGGGGYQVGPVVGHFNGSRKPDIAVKGSSSVNSLVTTLAVGLNDNTQGFYGDCNYPSSGDGIQLCSPSTDTPSGAITFAATANSFGQLRKMELWVDGIKLGEEHWIWGQSGYFYLTYPGLSSGTHDATIYAADVDNTLQRYDFNFTAGSN
jgi:hypothetical protein